MDLEVIPNSKEFKIAGYNPWTKALKIKVRGKALKGEANKELVKNLEKLLQTKIKIIAGEKSRKKKVFLEKISGKKTAEILKETLILEK